MAYVESGSVYIYTAPGREPVQIASDRSITNTMSGYITLSLTEWLRHPACQRYHDIGFFPKLDPTPEQFDPRDIIILTTKYI